MTTTHRFKAVPTSSFTGEDLDWMIGMRMMRRLVHSWSSDNFIIDSAGELGIYTQVPRNRRPSSFFFSLSDSPKSAQSRPSLTISILSSLHEHPGHLSDVSEVSNWFRSALGRKPGRVRNSTASFRIHISVQFKPFKVLPLTHMGGPGQWLVGHLAAGGGPPCQSFSGYVKWQPRNSQSRPRPENNCRKESRKSSRIWILPFHRFDLFTKKNKKAGGIRMVGYKYLPFHPHYSQIIHKHSRNSSEEIGSPTRPRDSTYIKRSKNF